jgi:hypothetical protein
VARSAWSEHLLDASQVGAAFEEMRRERVAQQMRVDPARFEPALSASRLQDQEGARPRERAALRVQEQLRPVALVEVRPTAAQVAGAARRRRSAERDDPLLAALADRATSRSSRSTPFRSSPTASLTRRPAP